MPTVTLDGGLGVLRDGLVGLGAGCCCGGSGSGGSGSGSDGDTACDGCPCDCPCPPGCVCWTRSESTIVTIVTGYDENNSPIFLTDPTASNEAQTFCDGIEAGEATAFYDDFLGRWICVVETFEDICAPDGVDLSVDGWTQSGLP